MAESTLADLYFPALVGGVRYTAPPRSLGDPAGQYIWRDSLNVVPRDGALYGRPVFIDDDGLGGSPPPQPPWDLGANDAGVEIPRFVSATTGPTDSHIIWVSNRSIWIYVNSSTGWVNCTPTYAVGTVTATNGSADITGAGGMLWQSRGITANQYILIDGTYYRISSVTGETTITMGSNFTGATAGGKAYTIRRMFPGTTGDASLIFCTVYNEDLYVAGTYIAGAAGTVAPAVIKVANIYAASPTTTYLTASSDLTGALDFISGLTRIAGVSALQDGRIVFAGNIAEVFYSSNLNTAVWTVSPGGSTPLADIQDPIRAQGRIQGSLTLHRANGVVIATPTNLSDPPLWFQASAADYGCVAPLTLRQWNGGEIFLAHDADVKMFDGHTSTSLGNGEVQKRIQEATAELGSPFSSLFYWMYCAGVYTRRNHYVLFFPTDSGAGTHFWVFDGRSWWPCATSLYVGAFSDANELRLTDTSLLSNVAGTRGTQASQDTLAYFGEAPFIATYETLPTYRVDTDDLDHGVPLQLKSPQRVILWTVGNAGSDNVTVSVRRVHDTSYTFSDTADPSGLIPTIFDFTPGQASSIGASAAHRYRFSGTPLGDGLLHVYIRAMVTGDVEAAL